MKKITITVTPIEPEKSVRILLEGEWTLNQTTDIKQELEDQIATYESVDVVLQHVHNFDVAGIQLLYALHKSAMEAGKPCRFELNLSNESEQLLNHTGFGHLAAQLTYVPQSKA